MINAALRREFEAALGPDAVLHDPLQLRTYECDGLTGFREVPGLVLLPDSTEQVAATVRLCAAEDLPFVARGAGTGLSGGAVPVARGVVISLARMRRILDFAPQDRRMVVQPGVTNAEISRSAAAHGLYYAPDPSSQVVCTIGGNVAENSGGAHCVKYGFTVHHVIAARVVLPDGSVTDLGGAATETPGPDLLGLFIGSEGTLGIATEVTVRLMRSPECVRTLVADFGDVERAGDAVSEIIAAGIVPAAVEMLDALAIDACEAAVGAGYTRGTAAALVVELDGLQQECDEQFELVAAICRRRGTTKIRTAADEQERARIWKGRKAAFAAVGRISPDYFVQEGVVPRTRLAEARSRERVVPAVERSAPPGRPECGSVRTGGCSAGPSRPRPYPIS